MLNGQNQYHGMIRKVIISFGRLFSDIKITRKDKDNSSNNQTVIVPIAYAPKEKWIVRLEQDPDLTNHTYTTLPRISFEITGYSYDPTRKVNRMSKINCYNGTDEKTSMFAPVPYNIDITLYILTKTQEDALQILEQILPTFTPEYSLSIQAVPEMNVIQDIPVILNGVSVSDEYDGDFQTRRFVTHTLNFTIKTNIYGPISTQGIIKEIGVNVGTRSINDPEIIYNAVVDPETNEVTENWEDNF
jgi:hypothetical protein